MTATESFARRKQTVFAYRGGSSEHPDGAALYAAARESRAPGWRPGAEIRSAVLDAAVAEVESRLAERVRQAADEVEKLVRTRRPYPAARPGFRVPPLDDDLLGELLEADDDAFQRATVVEVGERYRRRAGNDVVVGDRYDGRARRDAQQVLLEDAGAMERCAADRPEWSVVLAAVLGKYLSKLREYFRVACDKVLGGDLGERLAAHRAQVRQAADAAETALRTTSPPGPDPAVPEVSDETLAVAADGTSLPFIKEVVAEVGERYKRIEVEGRYTHLERPPGGKGPSARHHRAADAVPASFVRAVRGRGGGVRRAPAARARGVRGRLRRGGRPRRARRASAEAPGTGAARGGQLRAGDGPAARVQPLGGDSGRGARRGRLVPPGGRRRRAGARGSPHAQGGTVRRCRSPPARGGR